MSRRVKCPQGVGGSFCSLFIAAQTLPEERVVLVWKAVTPG